MVRSSLDDDECHRSSWLSQGIGAALLPIRTWLLRFFAAASLCADVLSAHHGLLLFLCKLNMWDGGMGGHMCLERDSSSR